MIFWLLGKLETIFAWLLAASWQASALALLVLAVQAMLRGKLNPRWRYALWLLVVLRLVLPSLPESAWSLFQFASAPPPELVVPVTEPLFVSAAPQPTPEPDPISVSPAFHPFSLFSALTLIWFTGALVLLALTWQINRRFTHQMARTPETADTTLRALFVQARAEIGLRRAIRLVESPHVTSPAIMGLFRPTLLLPVDLRDRFDDAELRLIFLHELAHLKRGDVAVQALIALLQILHWFNPVLWYAFRRMRADREPATDALVLSRAGETEKERYGLMLIKLLEHFQHRHALPTLVGVLEDKDQFKQRFTLIARFTRGAYGWSILGMLLLGILAVACLTKRKDIAMLDAFPITRTFPGTKMVIDSMTWKEPNGFPILRAYGRFIGKNPLEDWKMRFTVSDKSDGPGTGGMQWVFGIPKEPSDPPDMTRFAMEVRFPPANCETLYWHAYFITIEGQRIETEQEVTFTTPNPAHAAPLQPAGNMNVADHFPVTSSLNNVELALTGLDTGINQTRGNGPPSWMSKAVFSIKENGQPSDRYAILGMTITPNAGERSETGYSFSEAQQGATEAGIDGTLWKRDGPYSLNVPLYQVKDFTPEELFQLKDVMIPKDGEITPIGQKWTAFGSSVNFLGIYGKDALLPPGAGSERAYAPTLVFAMESNSSLDQEQDWVDLLSVQTASGTTHPNDRRRHSKYPLLSVYITGTPGQPATLTFAMLHQPTMFYFTAQPTLATEATTAAVTPAKPGIPAASVATKIPAASQNPDQQPVMIELTAQVFTLDEIAYQAHRSEVDAAVEKGDTAAFAKIETANLSQRLRIMSREGEQSVMEAVRILPYAVAWAKDASGKDTPTDFKRSNLGLRIVGTATREDGKIHLKRFFEQSYLEGWQPNHHDGYDPTITDRTISLISSLTPGETEGRMVSLSAEKIPLDFTVVVPPVEGPPSGSINVSHLKAAAQSQPTALRRVFLFTTAQAYTMDGKPLPLPSPTDARHVIVDPVPNPAPVGKGQAPAQAPKSPTKFHAQVYEIDQKAYEKDARAMDDAMARGDIQYFNNYLVKSFDLVLLKGQRGWVSIGQVYSYVEAPKIVQKDGKPVTVTDANAVFLGLNTDFSWSPDNTALTSSWQVTVPTGFENGQLSPAPRLHLSTFTDKNWDMAPGKAHGFWAGESLGWVKLFSKFQMQGGAWQSSITSEKPTRLAVFLTAEPAAFGKDAVNDSNATPSGPRPTLLEKAQRTNNVAEVKSLLDQGATVSSEDMTEALIFGQKEIVRLFWEHNARYCSPLAYAVSQDESLETIKGLLKQNPSNADLASALEVAAQRGNLPAAQLLIDHYAPVTDLALRIAAEEQNQSMTAFLLKNGAKAGYGAINIAMTNPFQKPSGSDPEVVRPLIAAGALKDLDPHDGALLLWRTTESGNVDILKQLLDAGLDPQATLTTPPPSGRTPLELIRYVNAEMAKPGHRFDPAAKQMLDMMEAAAAKLDAAALPHQIRIEVHLAEIPDEVYLANRMAIDTAVQEGDLVKLRLIKGADIFQMPSVTTAPDLKVSLDVTRKFPYPVKFDPAANIPSVYANGKPVIGADGKPQEIRVPPTPTNFANRDVGATAELTPSPHAGKIILNGKLTITSFTGFLDAQPVQMPSFDTKEAFFFDEVASRQTKGIWLPDVYLGTAFYDDKTIASSFKPSRKRLAAFITATAVN